MPIKHRKIKKERGQNALERLRAEMKKTADAIREEEEFDATTAGAGPSPDLAKRFPVVSR